MLHVTDQDAAYPNVLSRPLLRELERLLTTGYGSEGTSVTLTLREPREPGLLSLHGVGRELWAGEDAQIYVNRLRDEWER
jgi:hypothetical protein